MSDFSEYKERKLTACPVVLQILTQKWHLSGIQNLILMPNSNRLRAKVNSTDILYKIQILRTKKKKKS